MRYNRKMKSTRMTLLVIIWLFLQQVSVAVNASTLMSDFFDSNESSEHCHEDHAEDIVSESLDDHDSTPLSCCEIGCDCCIGGCQSVLIQGLIFQNPVKAITAFDSHLFSFSSITTPTLYRPPILTQS